jgi:hypothetical protein
VDQQTSASGSWWHGQHSVGASCLLCCTLKAIVSPTVPISLMTIDGDLNQLRPNQPKRKCQCLRSEEA